MKSSILKIISFPACSLFYFLLSFTLYGAELDDLNQELRKLEIQESEIQQRKQAIRKRIGTLNMRNAQQSAKSENRSTSQKSGNKADKKTSASLSYYWDNRDFTTLNLLTSTTGLPYDFSIWGFTDLHGAHESSSTDLSRYFIEYRLNRKIDPDWVGGLQGLGFQAEFNDSEFLSNNLFRFGLTYRHALPEFLGRKGWLQWRGFPYETDGSGQQASLIYFLPLHERTWISGFADINLRESQSDVWVIEPQLTYQLDDRFSLLVEYRFNGYEDLNPAAKGEGVALGMEVSF